MLRRAGRFVVILFLLSAAPAFACNEPSLGSVTGQASPGDLLSFSSVHLDPGATYTLSLDRGIVASGTADAAGTAAGTFTMPDVSRAGTYFLELHVAHEGSTWISSRPIVVTLPASTAPAPTASPEPKARSVAPRTRIAPGKATVRATTVTASADVRATKPKSVETPRAVSLPSVPSRPTTSTSTRTDKAPTPKVAKASPALPHPSSVKARPTPLAVAPISVDRPPFAAPVPTHHGVSFWPALAAGMLLLVGAAGAGVLVRSRRARLRLADLTIEAELQELIAEARVARASGSRDTTRVRA